jgi:AP endonuclease 1
LLTTSRGNAFALFLQSQRKWDNKPLLEENRLAFMSMCEEHKYNASDHVLPHGSYLVNLAQEDKDRAKQAYNHFLDDLKRCEALGIKMYNFHPGAAGKAPLAEAINRISAQLNRALAETQTAMPVLENMSSAGSVIGSRFTDLRDIIAGINPEHRSRVGVCIDTCHAFAAGYDLRTPVAFKETMHEFDNVVGMKYLKALHVNDSKAPFGSQRDLHQNIGLGFLGLRAFHNVMNEPRFHNMPLILETPCDRIDPSDPTGKKMIDDKNVWAREIKLLESLIGMDPEGDEFKQLELELSEKGRASREKMQKAIDEKNKKAKKKLEKGQRSLKDMIGKKEESTDGSTLSELSDEELEQ